MSEQEKNERLIQEADKLHRESNMEAMKYTGWKRRVCLWLARFYDYVGTELREIERDRQRGKGDA